jgi:hypothetical protein
LPKEGYIKKRGELFVYTAFLRCCSLIKQETGNLVFKPDLLYFDMDWFKFLLILAAVSLFIKIEGETSNVTGLYNACYIDRFAPNTMIPYTSIAEWVWKLTQACIVALMLQLCLWRDTDVFFPFELNWETTFVTSYVSLWYAGCYAVLFTLKTFLNDFTCAKHANSISGHYSFHVFYGLTMIYTIVSINRSPTILFNYFNFKVCRYYLSRKMRYVVIEIHIKQFKGRHFLSKEQRYRLILRGICM